jgi:uncharacterized membrane protein
VRSVGIDVVAKTRIRRPREEVAAYVIEPSNDPDWIGGVKEARLVGEPPLREGSRVARVASFLGRRIEYVNEVVALEPGRSLEMKSVEGPFPMQITYSFDEDGGATVMRNHVRGDASGFFKIATPLLRRQVQRSIQGDVERLRDLLEGRGR